MVYKRTFKKPVNTRGKLAIRFYDVNANCRHVDKRFSFILILDAYLWAHQIFSFCLYSGR